MLTAERLQVEVGADTDEAERKLNNLGDTAGGGRWTRALAGAGVAAFAAIGAAGTAVVGTGLKVAADMEQAEIAFETMLGSGEKAQAFLKDLKAFAAETPFEFPELQRAASSLVAAGFEANKVIPIMTTLGDVTSGMGTGSEGIKRATVALQQMSAAGRITGEDLNQLRDAGVPVFDLLTAATGKSKEEIAAMAQAGKLGRAEMEALFKALESGKGLERFNGLMAKQSKTLIGLVSTLKDNVGQSLAGMMAPVVTSLEKALPQVTDTIGEALEAIGPDLTDLATGLVEALKSILPSLVPILGAVSSALGQTFKALAPAVAKLLPAFLRILEAILPVVPQLAAVVASLAPVVVVLANALARVLEMIPTPVITAFVVGLVAVTQVLPLIMAALPVVTAMFLALASPIGLVIAAVAGLAAIALVVVKNWEPIAGFFTGLWDGVKAIFSAALESIRSNLGTFIRVALAVVTGGGSELVRLFVGHWSGIKNAVAGGIATVMGFITALPGRILGALANLAGDLFNLGKAAFDSMWRGINAIVPKLLDLAGSLVKKLVSKLDPRNWFSTPEEHYRMLWGAAFASIGDEARAAVSGINRQVGKVVSAADVAGAFGSIGPMGLDARIGPASASMAGAGSSSTTIIVQGSVIRERELYDVIRDREVDLTSVGTT